MAADAPHPDYRFTYEVFESRLLNWSYCRYSPSPIPQFEHGAPSRASNYYLLPGTHPDAVYFGHARSNAGCRAPLRANIERLGAELEAFDS